MLDFEVMAWSPSLCSVAEGPYDTKGIITKKLTFLTVAEPAELAGGSDWAFSVDEHAVVPRRHVEHLEAHVLVAIARWA